MKKLGLVINVLCVASVGLYLFLLVEGEPSTPLATSPSNLSSEINQEASSQVTHVTVESKGMPTAGPDAISAEAQILTERKQATKDMKSVF